VTSDYGKIKSGVYYNWQVGSYLWKLLKPIARELRTNQIPAEKNLWR
jgi:hypothetical protein